MASENETVAEAIFDLKFLGGELRLRSYLTPEEIHNLSYMINSNSEEIITAHKREIAEKDAEIAELQRTLDLHDLYADEECEDADTARIVAEDVAAGKDAEIAELRRRLKVTEVALGIIYGCVDTRSGVDVSLLVKKIIADALAAIREEGDAK